MSQAVLMPRPKGRPKAGSTWPERKKHIQCTCLLLLGRYPAAGLAKMHGVSERTIYYWRDLALGYDDPEAVDLRRKIARLKRGE